MKGVKRENLPSETDGEKNVTTKPKRKRRKKPRPKQYDDLISVDLQDKRYWNYTLFPVDIHGEYIGYTAEDVRVRVGRLYARMKKNGADYINTIHQVLDDLGFCKEKWRRGKILSAVSRRNHARRKEKRAAIEKRLADEARQAEFDHLLPQGE